MNTNNRGGRGLRAIATIGAIALGLIGVAAVGAPASAATSVPNLPDGPYTLNITKYAQPNPPLTLPHDGTQQNIPAGTTAIPGVQYSIAPVQGLDLTTAAGWQLTDGMTVSSTGVVTDAHGNVYSTGTAVALPLTDGNGATSYTTAAGAAPMAYVVTEVSAPNNVPNVAPPFLVTLPLPQANNWLTTVYAYPKNVTTEAPTKTVDDSGAFGLGQSVKWTVSAKVPNLPADTNLSSFILKDHLDSRLTPPAPGDVTVSFKTAGGSTVALDPSDYAVAVTGQDLSVTFTSTGLALLSQSANQGGSATAAFSTVVTGVDDGTILNTPVANINGHDYSGEPKQTTWGSLQLKKVGGTQEGKALQGAQFKVYKSISDAQNDHDAVVVNGQSTFTSLADGSVAIAGLRTGSNGDGATDPTTYYIVETQAPIGYNVASGYDKASGGHAVVVHPGSTANALITVVDPQVPPFMLPLTGSTGTALFVGGGIALIALAMGAAFVMYRRKASVTQV